MKLKLLLLTYIFINFSSFGQNYGSFASAIKINNTIYNTSSSAAVHQINSSPGAMNFDGSNIGSFGQNSTINLITAGEIKTFKTTFGNVCSGSINWRVYPVGAPSGAFNVINLGTVTDCNTGNSIFNDNLGPCVNGDQKWKDYSLNTNFINGLSSGNFILEIFYSITGSPVNNNTCEEVLNINNGGTNFKANFSVYSPSSSPTALPNPICEGNTLNLTANPTGGVAPFTFAWTGPNGFTSILQNPTIPNITLSGAGVYSVVTTDSLGAISPIESTSSVVVTPRIVPTFETLLLSYCRKVTPAVPPILPLLPPVLPVQLPNTSTEGIDGAWSLSPINDNPTAAPLFVDTNPLPIGPFQVTKRYYFYPNASECGNNTFVDITIIRNAIPTFGFPLVYCVGDIVPNLPTNSTNSVGGTWSNVSGAPITKINTNIIGIQQINFTPNPGLCAEQVAIFVNVKPKLTPTFNLPNFVCVNGPVPLLPTSSTNLPTSIVGTWSPAVVSNTITQTYNFTPTVALGNCSLPYSITINVNPIITPVTTFSYPTPICKNVANPSPIGNFTAGGVFSSTPGLVFVSTSTGVIDLVTSLIGTYTVTYTIDPDPINCKLGGSSTTTIQILPVIIPQTGFTYNSPVCKNSIPNPLPNLNAGFTTGGTFTSTSGLVFVTNPSLNGEINLSESTPGTYIITYNIVPNLATCQIAGTNTATIIIKPEIVPVTNFTYKNPVCRTLTSTNYNPILGTGFTLGGIFTSTPPGLLITSTNGAIDLSSPAGTYTVTYSIVADPTNCFTVNATSTAQITINPIIIPVTGFTYTTPVCINSTPNPLPILNAGFTTGGTFSSTSGLIINSLTGEINLPFCNPGTYIITYFTPEIASTCQIAQSSTASIEIKPSIIPVGGFSYTSPICKENIIVNPILTSGFTFGGTFSSGSGLTLDPATGAINVGTSTSGTYTVTYSIVANSTNCFTANSTTTAQIIITPTIVPVTGFSYVSPVCRTLTSTNYSINYAPLFTFGGLFTSSPSGLNIDPTTGIINLTSQAGTYTVTYTIVANATNCFTTNATSTTEITINPLIIPETGFSYTTPVCKNSTPNPSPILNSGFTTGGIFTSTAGLVFVSNTSGEISLSESTPGIYTITYLIPAIPATCQLLGTNTATIEIKPEIVPVSGFLYTSPVCRTQTSTNYNPILASGFTPGGTFTASGGLIINPLNGVIDLSSPSGTYTVTYSIVADSSTNCFTANSTSTAQITINPIIVPINDFIYSTPVCKNALTNPTPTLAAGFTPGGTFTSTSGLVFVSSLSGEISLSESTPGTYVVTYATLANTNTSVCQLAGSKTFTITISPIITPEVNFNYNTPICKNSTTNPSPNLASGFVTGGVFSSVGTITINPTTGVIDLSGTDVGSYVVTYTLPANPALCRLAGSSTTTITVNTVITAVSAFSYVTPVCKNAGTANIVQGTNFTFGGVFSCSNTNLTINTSTGIIDLSGSAAGTYTVNYDIVANATNCFSSNSSSSTQIIITPSTSPVTGFSYATPVCKNGINPSPILISGFTSGGTFSCANPSLSINSTTGLIDLASSTPGTYIVNVDFPNNTINCITAGNNSTTITINPTVTAVTGFSYNSPFCKNDANPSPIFVLGYTPGGTFTSSPSGLVFAAGSNGVIDLVESTPGTYSINYEVSQNTSTCLLAGNSSTSITINPMVNAITNFSYTSPVCKDGINPIPNFVAGYTTGGTFTSSPTGLVFVVGSNGVIDLINSLPGTYTVRYETLANNATCLLTGFSTATIVINANVNPVNTFSYTSPICKNSPNQSPILPNLFTTGGIFSSTSGLSINSATGVIDMVLSNPGTYTIRYDTPANNATCLKSGFGLATITINPVGTAVTTFSYATPICKNVGTISPNTSIPGFTTGGTYSSTNGLIINATTGAINLTDSTSGTYIITYNVNLNTTNCLSGSSSFTLVITEPTIPTFNPIVTSICKKELNVPVLQTTSTNGITGIWSPVLVSSSVVGDVVYTFTPDATFCATKPTITITTFEPTITPLFDNVSRSICVGKPIPTLPNTSQNGISGIWSPSLVNATNTGTYTFTSNAGQCAKDLTITITYVPEILSEITSECINANYTLTLNSIGNAFNSGNTYTWKDETGTPIQNANATSLNVQSYIDTTTRNENFPLTYSVLIKTPEGCESTQSFKIDNIYCGIQKGISPNNDSKNDFFDLTNFDVIEFAIFNRYGTKVYVKSGYKNEWVGQTDSGEILPDGTYFYNIEFANNEMKTGWVYINKEIK